MRTAICISGQCRTLDRAVVSMKSELFPKLGDYDVFAYVCEDEDAPKVELLEPKMMLAERDKPIDESPYGGGWDSELNPLPFQRYLQQLYGLKRVHGLMREYSVKTGTQYDWVVRLRTDSWFFRVNFDLARLDPRAVYLPRWAGFGTPKGSGFNDRFAIGGEASMQIYFNQLDYLAGFLHAKPRGERVDAEMATKAALASRIDKLRFIDVWFRKLKKGESQSSAKPSAFDLQDFCRWEYGYIGPRRPLVESAIAQTYRAAYHLRRMLKLN